jgi:hypothetical protein
MLGNERHNPEPVDSAYCTRPPTIDYKEKGLDFIYIHWQRASPNKADTWYNRVKVYKNSFDNLVDSVDIYGIPFPTNYTIFLTAADSGNYIFQVKELPLSDSGLVGMASSWSAPFVVPFDNRPDTVTSLVVQPQPILPADTSSNAARIFLSWYYSDPALVDSFMVIRRTAGLSDILSTVLPTGGAVDSVMDCGLWSETSYEYGVYVYDSLGQASDTVWASGQVEPIWMFTPAVTPFEPIYFSSDTIRVNWQWFDVDMLPTESNTYGAESCQVQVSIDPAFSPFQPYLDGPWTDAGQRTI